MKEDNLIENWLKNQENSEALEKAITLSSKLDIPATKLKEKAWAALLDKIETEEETKVIPLQKSKPQLKWVAWAISIAAMFLIGYFGITNASRPTHYETGSAEINAYLLPSGSEVTLNAESSINYLDKDWEEQRTLTLDGEAFFEVTSGVPFKVITENGEVEVLGTSFNIFSREGTFSVECRSGKVQVSTENKKFVLTKGDAVKFDKDRSITYEVSLNEIGAWRNGDFYFNQTPLKQVIQSLERQFEIEITVESDIEERIYNGYFAKSSLIEALQLVFTPMGLKFTVKENTVIVE